MCFTVQLSWFSVLRQLLYFITGSLFCQELFCSFFQLLWESCRLHFHADPSDSYSSRSQRQLSYNSIIDKICQPFFFIFLISFLYARSGQTGRFPPPARGRRRGWNFLPRLTNRTGESSPLSNVKEPIFLSGTVPHLLCSPPESGEPPEYSAHFSYRRPGGWWW